MKKALIIIDMQNDYFAGGKLELIGINEVLKNTLELIDFAKEKSYEIFFIQHISTRKNATFFLQNSDGVKLHKEYDIRGKIVIKKNYPNSFRDTILDDILTDKKIKNLIICGAMTHMCVDTTVRAGFDLGYRIELVSDACATKDLIFYDDLIRAKDVNNAFMASLNGIFCEVKKKEELYNG